MWEISTIYLRTCGIIFWNKLIKHLKISGGSKIKGIRYNSHQFRNLGCCFYCQMRINGLIYTSVIFAFISIFILFSTLFKTLKFEICVNFFSNFRHLLIFSKHFFNYKWFCEKLTKWSKWFNQNCADNFSWVWRIIIYNYLISYICMTE